MNYNLSSNKSKNRTPYDICIYHLTNLKETEFRKQMYYCNTQYNECIRYEKAILKNIK